MNKKGLKIDGGFLILIAILIFLFASGGKILSLFQNPIMVILIFIIIAVIWNKS